MSLKKPEEKLILQLRFNLGGQELKLKLRLQKLL